MRGAILFFAGLFFIVGIAWLVVTQRPIDSKPVASTTKQNASLRGRVISAGQPVSGARVRFKGLRPQTTTDAAGHFSLARTDALQPDAAAGPSRVTAWKQGYFIGGVWSDQQPLTIKLVRHPVEDSPDYGWVDPTPDPDREDSCGNCHRQIYDQWKASGHARSLSGKRLRNLFDGADWFGNPGRGWSLLADHPHGASVCVSCHGPTIDEAELAFADFRRATGVAAEGVHCDYCHKVQHASLKNLGLTHGRDALSLLRPSEGQLFFGPLDDVDRGEDVFSPLQHDSRVCAACHEGVVFGTHVYSTYSEWQRSPAGRRGIQCQDCHMAPSGTMTNIAPGHGGIERDPDTLASHSFLPDGRESMLEQCLQVTASPRRDENQVAAAVEVRASGVGHRIPTGFIDRHLILVVDAHDANGIRVPATAGPTIPPAAGAEYSGRSGRLFAKLPMDRDLLGPVPFWRAASVSDTRLEPETAVRSQFVFPSSTAHLRVRLLYRRFWSQVAKQKKWPDDTIAVVDQIVIAADD